MTLVYKETLAGGHVPLPDGGVRPARDDVGVLHRHTVDVTGVAPGKDRYSPLSTKTIIFTSAPRDTQSPQSWWPTYGQ